VTGDGAITVLPNLSYTTTYHYPFTTNLLREVTKPLAPDLTLLTLVNPTN
jgi:hypothetical protein